MPKFAKTVALILSFQKCLRGTVWYVDIKNCLHTFGMKLSWNVLKDMHMTTRVESGSKFFTLYVQNCVRIAPSENYMYKQTLFHVACNFSSGFVHTNKMWIGKWILKYLPFLPSSEWKKTWSDNYKYKAIVTRFNKVLA